MTTGEIQELVEEFHEAFGATVGDFRKPKLVDTELRINLIGEEVGELCDAVEANDLAAAADALADIVYVVVGSAVAWGIDLDPVIYAVHAANMRKAGGLLRDDGKIGKPADWVPPDIAGVLKKQVMR